MGKILIVDDDEVFLRLLSKNIKRDYPLLQVETCTSPVKALASMKEGLDLLLVDFEMPQLDGTKLLKYATEAGIDKNKIIILSSHDAEYLHEHFPMGSCLAVMNKYDINQKAVLEMIFKSLQRKAAG
jgi:CheY-like chemotaxis protein